MPAADPPTTKAPANSASAPPAPEKNDLDASDMIDLETFDQIREMDDPGSNEFSRAIVEGFLEQAKDTFMQMDQSLSNKDLEQLSSLGHFLKGSSATLGLKNVKDYCEKIQHFGSGKDEIGDKDMPKDECLSRIESALEGMKDEYEKVDKYFQKLYSAEEE